MKIYLLSEKKTNYVDEVLLENAAKYNSLILVKDFKNCDFLLLPHTWEFYYQNSKINELKKILEKANQANKQVVGITNEDFGYTPFNNKYVLFRSGGTKRIKRLNQVEVPSFFEEDPLSKFFNRVPSYRVKSKIINVGFCGKVNTNILNEIYDTFGLTLVWIKYKFDKFSKEPRPIYPTSNRLRNRVIKACSNPNISTNFILRKKYMNGLLGQKKDIIDNHSSTMDFFNNIRNTDYTLCMRGVGNYSIRFYQVLAMGRIPIFINTDCMLPFEEQIEWRKIIPWVEYKDIDKLPEILLDYHNRLSEEDFIKRQKMMRDIWEKYLSKNGFFNHIGEYIEKFANTM